MIRPRRFFAVTDHLRVIELEIISVTWFDGYAVYDTRIVGDITRSSRAYHRRHLRDVFRYQIDEANFLFWSRNEACRSAVGRAEDATKFLQKEISRLSARRSEALRRLLVMEK